MGIKYDTQSFIDLCLKVHGDRYDYSKVNYTKSDHKVTVVCKIHGEFYPTPNNHLSKKSDCPECAKIEKKVTLETFIERSHKIHNNKYDYSLFNLDKKNFTIVCPKHGNFKMAPHRHLRSGCKHCGNEKKLVNPEDFIKRAKTAHPHGNYDYSDTKYIHSSSKVNIFCKIHNLTFTQMPHKHLIGVGCQLCSKTGFQPTKPANLYVLYSDDSELTKIGITNNKINQRLVRINHSAKKIGFQFKVFWIKSMHGVDARNIEKQTLQWARKNSSPSNLNFSGKTESFNIHPGLVRSHIEQLLEKI